MHLSLFQFVLEFTGLTTKSPKHAAHVLPIEHLVVEYSSVLVNGMILRKKFRWKLERKETSRTHTSGNKFHLLLLHCVS